MTIMYYVLGAIGLWYIFVTGYLWGRRVENRAWKKSILNNVISDIFKQINKELNSG